MQKPLTYSGIFFLIAIISGCAGLEVVPPSESPNIKPAAPFAAPTANLQSLQTLHFLVKGSDYRRIVQIGNLCEDIYNKIMFDTNLLSFRPQQNYLIAIFRTKVDYHLATGYPAWSGGGTVTKPLGQLLPSEKETRARTAIYTWEENAGPVILAHEISHLVLNEFMEYLNYDEMRKTYWINEGFASYEELSYYTPQEQKDFLDTAEPLIRKYGQPLDQLIDFAPQRQTRKILGKYFFSGQNYFFSQIDIWYWQTQNIVKYLIEKHGQYNFYLLMNAFKQKKSTLAALQEAYPGRWPTLNALEAEWKESLK